MSEKKLPDIADELRSICFPFMIPGDTRTGPWFGSADLCHRAAAEITRLRAHAGWHEAIEPFAKVVLSSLYSDTDDEGYKAFLDHSPTRDFTRQDVLRARDAIIMRDELERRVRELLQYDGGEGSECYHAMKVFEVRRAIRALLPPGGEKV